jgi:hypothetical protein
LLGGGPTDENGSQDFSCACSNAKDELSSYLGPSCQTQSIAVANPIATTPIADTAITTTPTATNPKTTTPTGPIATTPTVPAPTGVSPSKTAQIISESPAPEGATIAQSSESTISSGTWSI